jgi:excisionase family DNA binding protein
MAKVKHFRRMGAKVMERRQWLTVNEFLEAFKGQVGRSSLYEHLRDGSLPSVRIGRKILIPADALDRLLERQPVESGTG